MSDTSIFWIGLFTTFILGGGLTFTVYDMRRTQPTTRQKGMTGPQITSTTPSSYEGSLIATQDRTRSVAANSAKL